MVKAGHVLPDEVVAQATALEGFLSGRDSDPDPQLPSAVMDRASDALRAYRVGEPDREAKMARSLDEIVALV
jgi:hypothetical protein